MARAPVLGRRIFFYVVTAWIALTRNFFIPRPDPIPPPGAAARRLPAEPPRPQLEYTSSSPIEVK